MMMSGPPTRPNHAALRGTSSELVHEVAEDQSVPPADDPAGPEEERPVLDRGERVGDGTFGRARGLLLQRDDPEDGHDAEEDEHALEDAGGHIPERELFALPSAYRVEHDGGADVRDDEQQLEERSEQDPVVVSGARDVPDGVVEYRLVEPQREDRRDEGDEEEHAEDTGALLIREHP